MNYKHYFPGLIAGTSEIIIFHPFETIGKRIMNKKPNIGYYDSVFMNKPVINLYRGISFAGLYRIPQRIYKFGFQPVVFKWVNNKFGENKTQNSFISGSIVGAVETVLVPLDIIKIRAQTNNLNEGLYSLIKNNPKSLFRGINYSFIRGSISSSCLFGVKAMSDEYFKDCNRIKKHMIGSSLAGTTAVILASPFDVLKTRSQTGTYTGNVFIQLVKTEGIRGLFLGIVPKTIIISPKLIFSFFVASCVQDMI